MEILRSEDWEVLVDHIKRCNRERLGPAWESECVDCGLPQELDSVWFLTKDGRLCSGCIERALERGQPSPR
jgi:hypothetical protein